MFRRLLNARIQDLWNLYEATGDLDHPGEKGLLREAFLRRVLESVLPPHFAIGSGIIVDRWDRQSPQIDLIVFDRRRLPPLLDNGGRRIYPVDAVLRAIEVKSLLDKRALVQLRKIARNLHPDTPDGLKLAAPGNLDGSKSYYPFASMFAYQTELSDIDRAKEELGGFEGLLTPICVVPKEQQAVPEVMYSFMKEVLDGLETSASSRKEFSLVEWL